MNKLFNTELNNYSNTILSSQGFVDNSQLLNVKSENSLDFRKIKIKSLIRSVGIPANILGYRYIYEALQYMMYTDKSMFLSEIYYKVAKNNETSCECVEVLIRNAIKKAVKISNKNFNDVFKISQNQSLSNSLFLNILKEVFFENYSCEINMSF